MPGDSLSDRVDALRSAQRAREAALAGRASADERAVQEFLELMALHDAAPEWTFTIDRKVTKAFFTGNERVDLTFTPARQGYLINSIHSEYDAFANLTFVSPDGELFGAEGQWFRPSGWEEEDLSGSYRVKRVTFLHSTTPFPRPPSSDGIQDVAVPSASVTPTLPSAAISTTGFDHWAHTADRYLGRR
jgi:hypothetical protein